MSDRAGAGLPDGYRLVTIAAEPDLWDPLDVLCSSVWPEFMLHDPIANGYWDRLRTEWPAFQLAMVDETGRVVAGANSAPLSWNGTDAGLPDGWDDQFERSIADAGAGRPAEALGALQIVVARDRRGRGLSAVILEAMRRSATEAGLGSVIACVRPTDKARYPLMSFDDYITWTRPDGLPFDPWMRVHSRLGARIVRASPKSMEIAAPVDKWREWTGLEFPVSGPYVAEGALVPLQIDLAAGRGVYYDPNVWMVHTVA
ncbi:MAG TPA: hypothetical protein VF337_00965 [Candidatus Limnocylindrales bacterium]